MTGTFQDKFEELAPHFIATAWDFTDRDDRVETIWVAIGFDDEDWTVAVPTYQIAGSLYRPHQVAPLGLDASPAAQGDLLDSLNALAVQYTQTDDEVPSLTVLRFQPVDSDLQAEFSYQPWEPGIKEDDRRLITELVHLWCKHLVETGDDSADWRPPQDYKLV